MQWHKEKKGEQMMKSIGVKIKTWSFRCGSAIQNEKDDERCELL